jgi:hypothetical protein
VTSPWAQTPHDVLTDLGARAEGLSTAEADARLASEGPNRLPLPPRDPFFKRLFGHLNDVLI